MRGYSNPLAVTLRGLCRVDADNVKLGWVSAFVKAMQQQHSGCGAGATRCVGCWTLWVTPIHLGRNWGGKGPPGDFVVSEGEYDEESEDESNAGASKKACTAGLSGNGRMAGVRLAKIRAKNPIHTQGEDETPESAQRKVAWVRAWAAKVSTVVGRVTLEETPCSNAPLVKYPAKDVSLHALHSGLNMGKVMSIVQVFPGGDAEQKKLKKLVSAW
jgi:hypothetical protein